MASGGLGLFRSYLPPAESDLAKKSLMGADVFAEKVLSAHGVQRTVWVPADAVQALFQGAVEARAQAEQKTTTLYQEGEGAKTEAPGGPGPAPAAQAAPKEAPLGTTLTHEQIVDFWGLRACLVQQFREALAMDAPVAVRNVKLH